MEGVGLGLRWDFLDTVLAFVNGDELSEELRRGLEAVPFFEVSPENYMRRGGYYPEALSRIGERFPLITHGLAMSLGAHEPPDAGYFEALRRFVSETRSPFHSDHLCFSGTRGRALHDLLPLPQLRAAAALVADHMRRAEDELGVPMAAENITYYLVPGAPALMEADFIAEVLARSNGDLLLDVNNVFVNGKNHGFDAAAFLEQMPFERVVELHVAGHERVAEHDLILDTHGAPVAPGVEQLLAEVLRRTGPVPVILERDNQIPPLLTLLAERERLAALYAEAVRGRPAAYRVRGAFVPQEPLLEAERRRAVELIDVVQRTVSDSDAPARLVSDPASIAPSTALTDDDREALRRTGSTRLLIYRALVRRGLRAAIRAEIPRTAALLGDAFEGWVERYFDAGLPRSRFLRDVAFEMFAWVEPLWQNDASLPSHALDLARYELASFRSGVVERSAAVERRPLDVGRATLWDPSVIVLDLGYAVHEEGDAAAPAQGAFTVLFHRDAEHLVQEVVLSPFEAEVAKALLAQATLGEALKKAAEIEGIALDEGALDRASTFLADMAERGALYGGA